MKRVKVNMNGPSDLKELLEHLKEEMETDTTTKTLVGTVPRPIAIMFKDLARKRKMLQQEIDNRVHELAIKAKQEVQKEFGERENDLDDYHDEVWARVTQEMGLDPNNNYQIDRTTGKMYLLGEDTGYSDSPYMH